MSPALLCGVLLGGAAGHGVLNRPLSRNGLSCNGAACPGGAPASEAGLVNGGRGKQGQASWFSNGVRFSGEATLTSKDHHQYLTYCRQGGVPPDYKDCDGSLQYGAPWRAPGTATVHSPCGRWKNGSSDGVALPAVPAELRATWTAGAVEQVAWAINANHGGGYSFRLCPASEALTEECFQRLPLEFADDVTELVGTDGETKFTIPALRLREGTYPRGSQWSRNPVPKSAGNFPEPAKNVAGNTLWLNIMDRVQVPSLAAGDYVLSWRWDCEETVEVWTNCADVSIAAASVVA